MIVQPAAVVPVATTVFRNSARDVEEAPACSCVTDVVVRVAGGGVVIQAETAAGLVTTTRSTRLKRDATRRWDMIDGFYFFELALRLV